MEHVHGVDGRRVELFLYVPGKNTLRRGCVPVGKDSVYTARHEIVLKPGDQITLSPGTKHWFQAPAGGAVIYSFSTCVRDGLDRFTDPAVRRRLWTTLSRNRRIG